MTYMMLVIIGNVAFGLALARLKVRHVELYQKEFKGLRFGSVKELARMVDVTINPMKYGLQDTLFRFLGGIFTLTFISFLIAIFTDLLRRH
ncbi:hypothetical protein L4X63_23470 [Geomonas sp. Red32]|uniref:hypothetical protein n=1 Tax=Geomonas sp. Red32 TaxID=2912856 RepID=UPI00202CF5B7|nr:hypothetical protein [Geomonas sp. Red32]MCM0084538.1 hypothetical protein [Geomonas sp. Red32]